MIPIPFATRLSRRSFLRAAGWGALASVLYACAARPSQSAPSVLPTPSVRPTPVSTPTGTLAASPTPTSSVPGPSPSSDDAVRRKIASLLVVGFRGLRIASDDWIMRAIADSGLGGVILFDRDQLTGDARNITSPGQVRDLIGMLREASANPLIVAIDQEGGRVARLNARDGFAATRSEAAIGSLDDRAAARSWAGAIAASLAAIGVTLNLAPVVDLDVNPRNPAIGALGRSFSIDPDVVVAMATEEIAAHHAAGIRTTIKHFPGFGSATGNTDFGVVDVSGSWSRAELEPFRRLIDAGIVDGVMAAHLLDDELDRTYPASLSHAVVSDLLRGELGWHGAVVSDDLQAAAITTRFGREESAVLAFQAGVDMLVFANTQVYEMNVVERVVGRLFDVIRQDPSGERRLDEAVARVDALRLPPAG